MKTYNWKLKGLSKKIDAELAVKELQRINELHGELTPEIIVNESKNENSILHNYFEWDNKKAADNWRLHQARMMLNNIEITVISNGETIQMPVYEIIENNYCNVTTMTVNEIDIVIKNSIRDLRYIQNKIKILKNFKKLNGLIDEMIKELSLTKEDAA